MTLNRRRSLDPRWMYHHRSVPAGWMAAQVQITRRSSTQGEWDPVTGTLTTERELVWEGPARIQPNKDWRVRYVESGTDQQLMQIVRVQIPLRDSNPPPLIKAMDIITVMRSDPASQWTPDTDLPHWRMVVRNMLNSSNPWLRNISAVVDVSDPQAGGV